VRTGGGGLAAAGGGRKSDGTDGTGNCWNVDGVSMMAMSTSGMRREMPHFGHLDRLPRAVSGAIVLVPQAGHNTGIGTTSLRGVWTV
jgi:hypothetical protein